ncbi:unnamed protein product [Lupinus luteus]|uniref:Uncharacterized protein n=1 Tax=Lupinus luteus TaxID=3873 RepID=A0AAV1WS89_LUPLU
MELVVTIDGKQFNIGVWEEWEGVAGLKGGQGVEKCSSGVSESVSSEALPKNVTAWISDSLEKEWRSEVGDEVGGGGSRENVEREGEYEFNERWFPKLDNLNSYLSGVNVTVGDHGGEEISASPRISLDGGSKPFMVNDEGW